MAISALAPYYGQNGTISNSVNTSLAFLSSAQTADGGFVSYGIENSESAAQVIIALCSLGIDPTQDERFIKNGKSVVDALRSYSVSGGGFAHTNGGAAHEISTQQALQAFTALYRLENGKTGVFLLDTQEDATPAGFRDVRFDGTSPTTSENSTDIKTIVCICVIAVCAVCILIILYLPKKKIK
jgi:prenyltransferase beta subunit